jgi:hypothetical protein
MMPGIREYPKIIAERVRSSAGGYRQEYLRLAPNGNHSVTLAVCRYEALALADEFESKAGELNLPDKIGDKTVIGVEDEWIVGGELSCCGSARTYRGTEISGAIDWLRTNGWVPTNSILAELFQAAFAAVSREPELVARPSTDRQPPR